MVLDDYAMTTTTTTVQHSIDSEKNRQISLTTEKYIHLFSFYTELKQ